MRPVGVTGLACAKVNLTLHVTGRRTDGLHLLDSLVVRADVCDRITVAPAAAWSLRVCGPRADGVPADESNLCLRAARATGGPPVAITLEKHLPAAAGIGGGSADAAATLLALSQLDGRALPDDPAALGADVPVCLGAGALRMRGVGARLTPLPVLPPIWLVLVNPGVPIATRDVFAGLAATNGAPMPDWVPAWPEAIVAARWLRAMRNDLSDAALHLAPVIADVLAALDATQGCLLARMSGSGATCFGLYADPAAADAAAAALSGADWWVRAARVLN